MKLLHLFIFILLNSVVCLGQQKFENGRITFSNNIEIDCFIKHNYSDVNPTSVTYKNLEDGEEKTANLNEISSFEVTNKVKFVKATIDFDTSGTEMNSLSTVRAPQFEKKTVLLQIIVEGKATLYRFELNKLVRYFYSIDQSEIKPLVYKKYKTSSNMIAENIDYLNQINLEVNNGTPLTSVRSLSYTRNNLKKHFEKYNQSFGDFKQTFVEEEREIVVKLNLLGNYHFVNNKYDLIGSYNYVNQSDSSTGFEVGTQLEVNFPFGYRKWSGIIETTYFKSNNSSTSIGTTGIESKVNSEISRIRLNIGARYNFYLNSDDIEKNIIYIEALVNIFSLKVGDNNLQRVSDYSSITDDIIRDYELNSVPFMSFGLGFPIYKKLNGNVRYNLPQENLTKYLSNSYKTSSFSVGLTYRLL